MRPLETLRGDYGLLQAVLDPYRQRRPRLDAQRTAPSEESRDYFLQLRMRLLREGPAGFSTKEKNGAPPPMRNP